MSDDQFKNLSGEVLMKAYEFVSIGTISMPDPVTFSVDIILREALEWEKAVYIFMLKDEILRVGSSKSKLKKRMSSWARDVSRALHNINMIDKKKTPTDEKEARDWYNILGSGCEVQIYARKATIVTTPVGTFSTYMDEESILINRHMPRLNWHTNR